MTSIDNTPPPPAPPPEVPGAAPKPSFFDRVIGVLMAPGETFESIARTPDWVGPVVTYFCIWLITGILLGIHIDYTSVARETLEMNPRTAEMSADQQEAAARINAAIFKVLNYCAPIFGTVVLLLVAAVLMVSFRLFGGDLTFKQAFSVTAYAWLPLIIKGVIALIVLMTRSAVSFIDLQNPVMSNLGFLADPKSNPLLFAAASAIDIFSIWTLVLLTIGYASASKKSRGMAATIVVGWWGLVKLLSLIGPAFQTMKR